MFNFCSLISSMWEDVQVLDILGSRGVSVICLWEVLPCQLILLPHCTDRPSPPVEFSFCHSPILQCVTAMLKDDYSSNAMLTVFPTTTSSTLIVK